MPGMVTTASLTNSLRQWDGFRVPPVPRALGQPFSELLPDLAGHDPRVPLFEALHGICSSVWQTPSKVNFEHLVHAAELLATVMPLPQNPKVADAFRFLPAPFLRTEAGADHWNIPGENYWTAAQAACFEILNWVDDACAKASTPDHPLARGLTRLARTHDLKIFSLNYDDIPEASGLSFYTGFSAGGRFEPRYPWPARGHTFCQLHGSVRFAASLDGVGRYSSRSHARTARRSKSSGTILQDGHRADAAPMITGLRKADKTLPRPFGTYMHVFREHLLQCHQWLVVGYGFGDDHVNQALLQARQNWRNRGVPVQAVIVDYYTPIVANNGQAVLDAWIGTHAYEVLDRICSNVYREDLGRFLNPVLARLAPSLFTELSPELAIDLNGTEGALIGAPDRILRFLGSGRTPGPAEIARRFLRRYLM